jgi:hypothetical protein
MDEGHAQHYDGAIGRLEIAGAAHPPERLVEGIANLDGLIECHKRTYKLRPMLEALRKTPAPEA